jgi:hypothetical protein
MALGRKRLLEPTVQGLREAGLVIAAVVDEDVSGHSPCPSSHSPAPN